MDNIIKEPVSRNLVLVIKKIKNIVFFYNTLDI